MMFTVHTRRCPDYLSDSVQACSSDPERTRRRSAACSRSLTKLVHQATEAGMVVNGRKTKEILMGSVLKDPPLPVTLSATPVERVTSFKLLGVQRRE